MTGDSQPHDAQAFVALRDDFPGWEIHRNGRSGWPWEARRLRLRPPGGIALLVAVDADQLREYLTAATAINTRHLSSLSRLP